MTVAPDRVQQLELQALELLQAELDPEARGPVKLEKLFEQHPFNEPPEAALFSWPSGERRYFLFVGNVMPMIYPDMELSPDELWAVHIGNEYFITLGVEEDAERDPKRLFAYLKMISDVFQQQLQMKLSGCPPRIEKVYRLEDRRQVVGYCVQDNVTYSWIVGDVPPFVYKRQLPPQIIWALHMGKLLLQF